MWAEFLGGYRSCWVLTPEPMGIGLAQEQFLWLDFLDFFFFSLSGDEEDELFKGATLKVPKSKAQSEEEDEDEVVRRSHTMPRPHTTTRGLFPTGSEKRSGVCWWPASWALCAGPCGSGLGAGRGKLCKHNGDGQVPLYSWTRTTVCLHAGMVCTVSEEGWAD